MLRQLFTGWAVGQMYLRGWRTPAHILVIESDDWGCIRTSSPEAYERLVGMGYAMERSPYSADARETEEDLDRLYEVLDSVRDRRGRPACFTAAMVMANPDFARIRESGFREYFYEPVGAAMAKDPLRRGVAERWAEGCRRKLFVPQRHCREHVRWWQWLEALRAGSREALATFEMNMCGVPLAVSREGRGYFAPPYQDEQTLARYGVNLENLVREGAVLFEQQFGFKSLSAVAPSYHWTDGVEKAWWADGVRYVQTGPLQMYPTARGMRRRAHFLGQRRAVGGLYLLRNCTFEPSTVEIDWLGRCLRAVARAFRFGRPAVVCAHRVNFIGSIVPANRDRGLNLLGQLLRAVVKRWPDVNFLSSPELGCLIERGAGDPAAVDEADVWQEALRPA